MKKDRVLVRVGALAGRACTDRKRKKKFIAQAGTVDMPTKRAVHIHTVYNASCVEPRLTIKKDRATGLLQDEVGEEFMERIGY